MSEQPLTLPGMSIALDFYFVCPEGHVHVASIQATSMSREMTNAALKDIQDWLLTGPMKGMRVATENEVELYRLAKSQGAEDAGAGYVMMPGTTEAQ